MKRNQTDFLKLCLADALIRILESKDFSAININEICSAAGVGRTTFYRHLDKAKGKENLLLFKIRYEWDAYQEKHTDEIQKDKGYGMTCFIYENRKFFSLLYNKGLIYIVMKAFEELIPEEGTVDKNTSYLLAFFTYGYFGIIYQWIRCDFDETPEQVKKHIKDALSSQFQ